MTDTCRTAQHSIQHIPVVYLASPGETLAKSNFYAHVKANMTFSARCKPVTIINILATQNKVAVTLL